MSRLTSLRSNRFAMAAGLAVVGAAGFAVGKLLKGVYPAPELAGWSDGLSLVNAASLVGMGLLVAGFTLSARAAGRMVDPEGARPASTSQLAVFRQQAAVMILAGVMLSLPVLLNIGEGARSFALRATEMAAIVALFAAQTVVNVIVWRRADEFARRLISETSAVCFWVLQGALFLWAAGERLGLLPAISAWDAVAVLMTVYLVASAAISLRRGGAG